MKIDPNVNIPIFLDTVQKCKGSVWFTTPEGDSLNLKSTLSQVVFATVAAKFLKELHGDIQLDDKEDMTLIRKYIIPA